MVLITLFVLCLAVAINSGLVWMYRHGKLRHYSVNRHMWLITPMWLLFVFCLFYNIYYPGLLHDISWLTFVSGFLLVVASVALFVYVVRLLGFGALVNRNIFEPTPIVRDKIFEIHPNPMYLSYSIGIVALGLLFGVVDLYVVAAVCYVLLNYVEARIEQP